MRNGDVSDTDITIMKDQNRKRIEVYDLWKNKKQNSTDRN